jgi:glutamate synthase domain-containing protein 1
MMMMIPEAYAGREDMPEELRGFYAFHGCPTEPWTGRHRSRSPTAPYRRDLD